MLDERDVLDLLTVRGAEQQELFARARAERAAVLGEAVTIRGVCEVTNVCRVNCLFCPMRRANTRSNDNHQKMAPADLVATARTVHAHGIDVICGEVPQTTPLVGDAIPAVRELSGAGLRCCSISATRATPSTPS